MSLRISLPATTGAFPLVLKVEVCSPLDAGPPVADDVLCDSTSLAFSLVSEVRGLLGVQGEARSEGLAIVG